MKVYFSHGYDRLTLHVFDYCNSSFILDSHQFNPRASDEESSNDESASEKKIEKPSSEEQARPKKEESSKEHDKADKSDDDGDDEDRICNYTLFVTTVSLMTYELVVPLFRT